ncbi:MAG: hypothetical protein HY017_25655 [Betaproteobacteria bacterium]|nr:hypothetical protein [Betaproteobacteria bacterium]
MWVLKAKRSFQGWSDHVGRVEYRISLKAVEDFLQVKLIEPRLRAIASSSMLGSLSTEHQRAAKTFLDTVDGKASDW